LARLALDPVEAGDPKLAVGGTPLKECDTGGHRLERDRRSIQDFYLEEGRPLVRRETLNFLPRIRSAAWL
jgi:hypothetical protein